MRRAGIVALGVLLVLTLAGCGRIAEEAAEEVVQQTTGVNVEQDGEKVTIEGEDGEQIEIGSGAELPDDFPSDVPVYKGADVVSTSTLSDGGAKNFYISLQTTDAFEDVVEWYKSEMDSKGWEIEADVVTTAEGSSSAILGFKKGEAETSFSIATDDSGNTVITNNVRMP